MRIKVEYHPNPACASFHVDVVVNPKGYESWSSPESERWEVKQVITSAFGQEALREPVITKAQGFVKAAFDVQGITQVSLSRYEIHVQKGSVFEWSEITPEFEKVIREHFDAESAVSDLLKESAND